MKAVKKYVLWPRWLMDDNGIESYIDYVSLAMLYGVDVDDCYIEHNSQFIGLYPDSCIHLYPRADGKYEIPESRDDS